MSNPVTIEVEELQKIYSSGREDVVALDGIDLQIEPGEFLSIVGPSGCGKSTLMLLIAGLIAPTDGRVTINGSTVDGPFTDAAVVFQRDVLMEWRTVRKNVLLPAQIKKLDQKKQEEKALALLAQVGLQGFEDRYPHELSGGMRQRVSLARALVQDPPLLLLDEPFGALDALTRDQMCLDLSRLVERGTQTTIFITHSIDEAVFLADRVAVFSPRPGRILELIDVELPRPRKLSIQTQPHFLEYVDRIRAIFSEQGILRE
ncbi:MAG: ABC transporter ATP-binding protein [bacterium]